MNLLEILKLRLIIVFRTQLSVTADKIDNYLNKKLNKGVVYFLAYLFRLYPLALLFYAITNILLNETVYVILSVLGGFTILLSLVRGRIFAKQCDMFDTDSVFLCSSFSDKKIFVFSMVEGLLRYFIRDVMFFISNYYILNYLSSNILEAILRSIIFTVANIGIFVIGNIHMQKSLRNSDNEVSYFREIIYAFKYILCVLGVYVIYKYLLIDLVKVNVSLKVLIKTPLESLEYLRESFNSQLFAIQEKLSMFFNVKVDSSFSSASVFNYYIGLCVFIAVFIFIKIFFTNIEYRKKYYIVSTYKRTPISIYIKLIEKLNILFYKGKDFYVEKDLKILYSQQKLIYKRSLLMLFFPLNTSILLGTFLFFVLHDVNTVFTQSYVLFFIVLFMLNTTYILKKEFNLVSSFNSELRNIQLIKLSNKDFQSLLKSKTRVLRLLTFLPASVFLLGISTIVLRTCGFSLYILLLELLGVFYIISPYIAIYGDVYFDQYNYTTYKELYENRFDKRVFDKFFTVPNKLILLATSLILTVLFFINMPLNFSAWVSLGLTIYLNAAILVIYYVAKKLFEKGEKALLNKYIQTE